MLETIKNITETLIIPGGTRHYLIPLHHRSCERLQEAGFSVAGMTIAPVGYSVERRAHSTHEVLYTLSGSGTLRMSGRTLTLLEGEVMVLPARSSYHYQTCGAAWSILWFHLQDLSIWPMREPPEPCVRPGIAWRELRRATEGLLAEHLRNDGESARLMRLFAEQIVLYLSRELSAGGNAHAREMRRRIGELRERLSARLRHGWTVPEMAAELHMSPAHFHRVCLCYGGSTPKQLLFRLRMERAEDLLLRHDYPLKNIAEELGYGSPFAFSNAFKRYKGISPEHYRKRQGRI